MKDISEFVAEVEPELKEFMQWQISHGATNNFRGFAEATGQVEDVFKYAAILYPNFILVEGAVLLADHYSPDNWAAWRKSHDPLASALAVNHVHIDHYLANDRYSSSNLVSRMGKLLEFFWQMAVNQQFPDAKVVVEYNGDVISFTQEVALASKQAAITDGMLRVLYDLLAQTSGAMRVAYCTLHLSAPSEP